MLGLSWADIDLERGQLRVRQQLERRRWRHGCEDPERCDEKPTMTARYQHVVPELVEEANRRMSELLWDDAPASQSDITL